MTNYNYREEITSDILDYINSEICLEDFDTLYQLENHLNDVLWCEDSVTGNASGSYTFNSWQAEEYIAHNLDLLEEAMTEFGCSADYLVKNGAESADVTIRCYLLGECICSALEEIEEQFESLHNDEQESEVE